MDDRFNRIEDKLDHLFETNMEQTVILSAIRKDLNYHIKRTDLLEEKTEEAVTLLKWGKVTAKLIGWTIPVITALIGFYYTYIRHKS